MFTILLFDLDNTIFNFNMAEHNALSKTLHKMGIEPTESICNRYSELNLSQWKRLELGEITREQVKLFRFELLFNELGINCDAKTAASTYEGYLSVGHFFMDGAEQLLKKLSSMNQFRLFLVTNGTKKVQDGRLKSANISHYFENIFISEAIGYNKPQIEYFNKCFSMIPDFDKEKTVIIGDSLTSDMKGGILAGIKTIWFNPSGCDNTTEWIPDYEIHKLSELLPLLQ